MRATKIIMALAGAAALAAGAFFMVTPGADALAQAPVATSAAIEGASATV